MILTEMLKARRTIRKFDESRPIPASVIGEILEAGRLASSASNIQPIRYAVVASPEKVKEVFGLTHWAGRLPKEVGTPKEGERPTLFIALCLDKDNKFFGDIDIGLAAGNMTLAAWNRGVGSCLIGSHKPETVREALGLPENLNVRLLAAFGYPAMSASVTDAENGEIAYYLDENGNNVVPKRPLSETVVLEC